MGSPTLMELASSAVRGCIVAPPGCKLVVADLAGIENRVLAWLAGEGWKLQALRDYDAGTGPDLYKLAYSKSFAVPVDEVTKDQRQIGKVMELALGYAGGVGAFATMAAGYGMDLEDLADKVHAAAPGTVLMEAMSFLDWLRGQGKHKPPGMSDKAFVACDTLKRMWRAAHPATTALWRSVEEIATCAVQQPGVTVQAGRIRARRDGQWLRLAMPSGRALCYPRPEVDEKGQLSYMGTNQYTRKWERLRTYSGKLVENLCQAVARDVLASTMPAIEEAGYRIVLSVHDELLTETPDDPEFTAEQLAALMSTQPDWAKDLPLAAEGFEAKRYRK